MAQKYNLLEPGTVFGSRTIVQQEESNRRGRRYLVRCACGTERVVDLRDLKRSDTCGCARKEAVKKNSPRPRLPPGEAGLRVLYAQYRSKARDRGYSFELSLEEFRGVSAGTCHYCGTGPSLVKYGYSAVESTRERSAYTYTGVDRLDNERGYTLDNVVPCCKNCNRAKLCMTETEFLDLVRAIFKHRGLALDAEV